MADTSSDIHSWINSGRLAPLLEVIDRQLEEIWAECALHPSLADALWFSDLEALVGLGFVACQQFLVSSYRRFHNEKWKSLVKGPQHPCGVSYAQLVDAAANFWKHEGEWVGGKEEDREAKTRAVLEKLCSTRQDYVLSNVLDALVKPGDARFARLVPWLETWRDSLPAAT